jgi:hypothetical protein
MEHVKLELLLVVQSSHAGRHKGDTDTSTGAALLVLDWMCRIQIIT